MKKWLKLRYPKLFLLFLTFIFAYLLFKSKEFLPFNDFLLSSGYISTFFSGIFFSYGFTAAPATAILLIISGQKNILFEALIGGLGALVGDFLIFKFIRFSLSDEIKKLSKEKIFNNYKYKKLTRLTKYVLPILAGFIIASPLPDEIGVSLLALSEKISVKEFVFISYILNTVGIFIILLLGSFI